jgi:RHH-type transcriptional regulator, proline utilization regulon repressor / proline dehydrogenase / delta 1-pyrroline-5-carboxylate dehydrogenase
MDEIAQRAVARAESLLAEARAQITPTEQTEAARLARMMDDPDGKAFTLEMVDRVFRSRMPTLQAARLRKVLRRFGVPRYLAAADRWLLIAGAFASRFMAGAVMAAVDRQLRHDSAKVVLPGESDPLARYLSSRKADGTRVNVNHLGEAVLGEEEAAHRLEAVLGHLANPRIDYVSVKISALFSQINLVDWDGTLREIQSRLRRLYRAALAERKFVNLDMEEYRDLALTLAAFQRTLDEPEFQSLGAGIVLQAYLPDSWAAQRELTAWARKRVQNSGAQVKLRLVKGANLAMESVEAELHDWNAAPYGSKAETDANYRRMLEFACRPENAAALRLGVASHNLFDVALALELRERDGVEAWVEIEMLEGMASHQSRAVRKAAGGLLVYAPVVKAEDFNSAMAYLVRRLDENTAPDNFLRDLFALEPGSVAWERQKQRFLQGWSERHVVTTDSRRAHLPIHSAGHFHNAADTDWSQTRNREKLAAALAKVGQASSLSPGSGDGTSTEGRPLTRPAATLSPSDRERDGVRGLQSKPEPSLLSVADLDQALSAAAAAQSSWEHRGFEARAAVLRCCAEVMEAGRFDTIALMVHDAKKAAAEADAEISEAIDFARYYAGYCPRAGLVAKAHGIVAVIPPWNFPYAIPCGGVLAALMAGNAVVLKPAPETTATAARLAEQLWDAGVPRDVLHFFPCADGDVGRALITDPRVKTVVLTGALETARMFQGWRPSLRLFAETSGKNALIVTAQADRDLAIKDLVKSAFGHSGQKCSAASIGILEAEVYADPMFLRQLRDAAASLHVGPSTHSASIVTPLIREPSPNLLRALTTLDDGEEWLLEPKVSSGDPCLWSPGIKRGVKPGGWFHKTECFGPVLGLMRAADLDEAIAFQNAPDYGLTGGIHSLDDDEVAKWKERVQVGNAYINRSITGAIVQRQPFGGWKRSSIGPGSKAGGPDYVGQFLELDDEHAVDLATVETKWREIWKAHIQAEHDPSGLHCESNVLRYRPAKGVLVRVPSGGTRTEALPKLASTISGTPLLLSHADEEPEEALAKRLPEFAALVEFFRSVETPGDGLLAAVHFAGLNWINAPFVSDGRAELIRWTREQSVTTTMHRYGLPIIRRR